MARVLTGVDGVKHLRKDAVLTLCGAAKALDIGVTEDALTCPECAKVALLAVELVTKVEKREWRKL
jgi:hypothetical protein